MRRSHTTLTRSAPPRVSSPRFEHLAQEFNRTGKDFLKIDLQTAFTFSRAALSTDDPVKRRRNQKSARKAYDTVLNQMKKIDLSEKDNKDLKGNLRRLKSELTKLGEVF